MVTESCKLKMSEKSTIANQTCSICNKRISQDGVTCSACNNIIHRECCDTGIFAENGEIMCIKCTKGDCGKSTKSSQASTSRKKELKLQQLEEQRALKLKEVEIQKTLLTIEREFLAQKYSILEQDILSDSDKEDFEGKSKTNDEGNTRVKEWVQNAPPLETLVGDVLNTSGLRNYSTVVNNSSLSKTLHIESNPYQEPIGTRGPLRESLNLHAVPFTSQVLVEDLTPSQIRARKILSELPKFNGKPKDWAYFITSFEESTKMCGFKNFENIARLRQCLKGVAYEAVHPQLTMNGNVQVIISTLTTLFGRPELIINELISDVNDMKPIKEENMVSIMQFAIAVQNLVSTLSSAKFIDHLRNPTLLDDLVKKLSASLKLQWGMRKLYLERVSLADFNDWIQEISLSARMVSNEYPKTSFSETKLTNKDISKRTFLNVHAESENPSSCLICDSDCKSVAECEIFQNLTLKKKWDEVNNKQLCRCCLERRHKLCPNEKLCGVQGCSYRHHQLLHKFKQTTEGNTLDKSTKSLVATQISENDYSVLFRIVPVTVFGPNSQVNTFAFLDDGSGLTLMDEDLAEELELVGIKQPLCLTWTGNTSRLEDNSKIVSLDISSVNSSEKFYMPNRSHCQEAGPTTADIVI